MIFNRFTREARRCVEAAVEEARALGHDSVEDEDLLLGVLAADTGIAAEAMDSLGVSLLRAVATSLSPPRGANRAQEGPAGLPHLFAHYNRHHGPLCGCRGCRC